MLSSFIFFADYYHHSNITKFYQMFSKFLTDMSKLERIALFRRITKHLVNFYNYAWLFLEIHMQKIVFISFILLCINDVSKI